MISGKTALFFITLIVVLNALNIRKLKHKKQEEPTRRELVEAYSKLIEGVTDEVFGPTDSVLRKTGMNYARFEEEFRKGAYGQMVKSKIDADSGFVKRYWDMFNKNGVMKAGQFFWFSTLNELEAVLISEGAHPKLSAEGITGEYRRADVAEAAMNLWKNTDAEAREKWFGGEAKVNETQFMDHFKNEQCAFKTVSEEKKDGKFQEVLNKHFQFYDFGGNKKMSLNTWRMFYFNYVFRGEKYLLENNH